MAGVYNRDNIAYSNMLQNAIANRSAAAQRDAQYIRNKGELWGNAVKDVVGIAGRGISSWLDETVDEEEAELERLKKLRAERAERAASEMEGYVPYEYTPAYKASQQMAGYRPHEIIEEPIVSDSYRASRQMDGYIPFEASMSQSYSNNYTNPYSYALMQDYYRRGR